MRPVVFTLVVGIALCLVVSAPSAQFRIRYATATAPPVVSNPISSPRHAVDVWADAGVEGGIPTNRTRCTTGTGTSVIAAYTGTAGAINTAITGCDANHFVELGAGTFTLSSGIALSKNSITLKGQGADSTKIIMNGSVSAPHYYLPGGILISSGDAMFGNDGTYDHSANWTAGYSLGTTVVTLSSVSGLTVGETLYLDQLDDTLDGYPATGDLYVCADENSFCSDKGGGNNAGRADRSQVVAVKVMAINGTDVTIDPPLFLPNWRSGKTPGAWWNNTGTIIHDTGVENLSLDVTGMEDRFGGVFIFNALNCWMKGLRIISEYFASPGVGGTELFQVLLINTHHVTVRDSYIYGPKEDGNQQYSFRQMVSTQYLFENNIIHSPSSPILADGPVYGSVAAFNYVRDTFYSNGGVQMHGMTMMNLTEGNNMGGYMGDITHSPHFFETAFRNHLDGEANNPDPNDTVPVQIETHNRFFNVIGNVLGDASRTTYEVALSPGPTAVFNLGWEGDNSWTIAQVPDDTRVKATLFRWGNWDTETNATRWCGNSSSTGWGTTCSSTSEVPTGITNYAQTVPSTETLPNSLYLSAKPAFFGSVTWPPIGPDVTGGDITGYAGHAYKIPARACFESLSNDAAYPTSSPRIKTFSASTCYPRP